MEKLVVLDACVRQSASRTWRIAAPVVEALRRRYDTRVFRLYEIPEAVPLTPVALAARTAGKVPAWASEAARCVADADRILIAAPFWDMGVPAVLKSFLEQISLYGITFTDDGAACVGLCRSPKVLFITTRGMNIQTGSPLEQATPYLRALGSLWNLGELTTIAVSNMDYMSAQQVEDEISKAVARGLKLAVDDNW